MGERETELASRPDIGPAGAVAAASFSIARSICRVQTKVVGRPLRQMSAYPEFRVGSPSPGSRPRTAAQCSRKGRSATGTATSLDGAGEEAPQRRVHFIVRRRRVWPSGDVVGASGTKRTDFQARFRPRKPFEGPPPWLCDWIGSPRRGDGGLRRRTLDKLSSARRSKTEL